MTSSSKRLSLFRGSIVRRAAIDSLVKLNPLKMMRNPVMFVVEVGSVLTTVMLFSQAARAHGAFRFDL